MPVTPAMLVPHYADERATLYRGDALAVLRDLPDASVDAVITDPPYSSGGMVRGDRMASTGSKYSGGPGGPAADVPPDFTGDTRDQRAYAYWCALWLGECLRVAKPGAPVVLFTDWRQLPSTTDAIQAGGWVWRGIAVWDKTDCGGRPQMGRYRAQAEYLVWGSAGPMPDRVGVALPGVFRYFVRRTDRDHLTGKPVPLMRDLLQIVPRDGVVLDPFTGAGTTGVAALIEGRRFIGVELTDHYADVAARRLATAAMRPTEDQLDLLST